MLNLTARNQGADDPSREVPDIPLALQVWTLFVDQVTALIVSHFEDRGIHSILLKGPGFARLFYEREYDRPYTDTDLLVQEHDVPEAEEALRELGFARVDRDEDWIGPAPKYSHTFHRPADGALLDLHWRLSGALASPDVLWSCISSHTVELEVGGRPVASLDAIASALLTALHNAHHGTGRPATLTDLDRAVDRLSPDDWLEATCLADELAAGDQFAAGLRLTHAGNALADRLGLHRPASVELWLKVNPSTYGAWVLDRFTQTHTLRGRARILLQVAVPPRVVMYRFFPLARRGRGGLVLAYMLRPLRLGVHAGPAIRDWVRAFRAQRRQRSPRTSDS